MNHGPYEVVEGQIYQVRGYDLSNMSIIRRKPDRSFRRIGEAPLELVPPRSSMRDRAAASLTAFQASGS